MDYIRSFCGLPELDMTYMIYYLDSGCTAFKLKISSLGIVRGVLLLLAMLAAPWQQILLAMLYGMPWYGMVWYIHSVHTLLYQIIDHICNIYIYIYIYICTYPTIHGYTSPTICTSVYGSIDFWPKWASHSWGAQVPTSFTGLVPSRTGCIDRQPWFHGCEHFFQHVFGDMVGICGGKKLGCSGIYVCMTNNLYIYIDIHTYDSHAFGHDGYCKTTMLMAYTQTLRCTMYPPYEQFFNQHSMGFMNTFGASIFPSHTS